MMVGEPPQPRSIIEELFGAEDATEDREEDDTVDAEIDLDAEDWFGSIEDDRRPRATPPRFERPAP